MSKGESFEIIFSFNIITSYVGATFRGRAEYDELGWSNSSLASRLPKWIISINLLRYAGN
jgi:hypothetical protein